MTDVVLEPAPAAGERKRRPRKRWALALAAVLVVAVSLGVWLRWLYTPNVFWAAGGYEVRMNRTVGATVYSPAMVSPERDRSLAVDLR